MVFYISTCESILDHLYNKKCYIYVKLSDREEINGKEEKKEVERMRC
jgi:hypothetical protein